MIVVERGMKPIVWIAILILAVILISSCTSRQGGKTVEEAEKPLDVDAEIAEIKGIISKYAQAVNDDNVDTNLASRIWSNEADVSFIHPRGHEHGWEQIKTNFYEKTMRDNFSERKLDIHDIVVHAHKDWAWVEFYWDFAAKLRSDGSAITTKGRESEVYEKSERGWKLVHVHYSGMPVTGKRQGF